MSWRKELAGILTAATQHGPEARIDEVTLARLAKEYRRTSLWDRAINGLNRLPRPLFAFLVLAFFVLPAIDPQAFRDLTGALKDIPNGFWAIASIIITFYFGGRLQVKAQDFQMEKRVAETAKEIVEVKKREAEIFADETIPEDIREAQLAVLDQQDPSQNRVIREWKRRHAQPR